MLRIIRGRWAAAGIFFACPGAILACTRGSSPPLHWQASDFEWPRRQAAPTELPSLSLDSTFVSPLLRGQFTTLAPPVVRESEQEEGDTGFRRSLERFWASDSVPSHLDGAQIDVTGTTTEIEGCSDAIFSFEQAVAAQARWLTPVVIEDAQRPVADDHPPHETPELRFPLTGEVWNAAEFSEDMNPALRWMIDAEANFASGQGVIIFDPPPRRVVFTGPEWDNASQVVLEFDAFDPPRRTETVERIWPTRPVVATLVVTYRPSGCRGLRVSEEPLVHRFPLALMASEP